MVHVQSNIGAHQMIVIHECVSVCFAVMFHGPPVSKVKREPSPSKELSPCRTPHTDMCLYSYRYEVDGLYGSIYISQSQ